MKSRRVYAANLQVFLNPPKGIITDGISYVWLYQCENLHFDAILNKGPDLERNVLEMFWISTHYFTFRNMLFLVDAKPSYTKWKKKQKTHKYRLINKHKVIQKINSTDCVSPVRQHKQGRLSTPRLTQIAVHLKSSYHMDALCCLNAEWYAFSLLPCWNCLVLCVHHPGFVHPT